MMLRADLPGMKAGHLAQRCSLKMPGKGLTPLVVAWCLIASICHAANPTPKPWPPQFYAQLVQNNPDGALGIAELWYDFTNGRNYNIMQQNLGNKIWELEWNNGTSFHFDLEHKTCTVEQFPVGIVRPDFMNDAHYLGVESFSSFTCNKWEKADFMTYWEDVKTKRPVGWSYFTGMSQRVITFEEGAVLSDPHWQAPSYCFRAEGRALV